MTISFPGGWIDRKDLALLKFSRPDPIGDILLPTYVMQKFVDIIVYQQQRNAYSVVTNRANGGAFVFNNLENTRLPIDLTAAKIEFALQKDINQWPEYGTDEYGWRQMAFQSLFQVSVAIENTVAVALLDGKQANLSQNTTAAKAMGTFVANVKTERNNVAKQTGEGRVVVAMSQSVFNNLMGDADLLALIKASVSIPVTQTLTVAQVQKMQLAALFNVDEVLIGQSTAWYASNITQKDCVVVANVAQPGIDPLMSIQLGRLACYMTYVAQETVPNADLGAADYDQSRMITMQGAKAYAAPWSCAQTLVAANGAVALVTQAYVKPVIFNAALYAVVGLPTVGSASI